MMIFHKPRFPWHKGISLPQLPFRMRSREVRIWPKPWHPYHAEFSVVSWWWMRVGLSLDTSTVQSSAGKTCSKTQKSQKDRMHRFRYPSEFNMLYPTKYVNLFLRVLPLLNFVIQNINKMKKNQIHTLSQTFLVNKKDLTSEFLTNKLNQLNFWLNYYKGATTHNHSCFFNDDLLFLPSSWFSGKMAVFDWYPP